MLRIAHRGYAAQGGENSLASIARALDLGCDMVEVDVRRRHDGDLLVSGPIVVRDDLAANVIVRRWKALY